jgi:methylglutaconyl-CoA hydratase
MGYQSIEVEIRERVAYVTLNRPDKRNAFHAAMIQELIHCFGTLGEQSQARIVVLTGRGTCFSAGADLNWMLESGQQELAENERDASYFADLFSTIDACPLLVIGQINGAAIGGGTGLTAVCDIAIASEQATFRVSDTQLGIIPAAISPFVINKIGVSHARHLLLTGQRISAQQACAIGLVHEVVPHEALAAAVAAKVEFAKGAGPQAVADCKRLIRQAQTLDTDTFRSYRINEVARIRAREEAQEGFAAFLEKRQPNWMD